MLTDTHNEEEARIIKILSAKNEEELRKAIINIPHLINFGLCNNRKCEEAIKLLTEDNLIVRVIKTSVTFAFLGMTHKLRLVELAKEICKRYYGSQYDCDREYRAVFNIIKQYVYDEKHYARFMRTIENCLNTSKKYNEIKRIIMENLAMDEYVNMDRPIPFIPIVVKKKIQVTPARSVVYIIPLTLSIRINNVDISFIDPKIVVEKKDLEFDDLLFISIYNEVYRSIDSITIIPTYRKIYEAYRADIDISEKILNNLKRLKKGIAEIAIKINNAIDFINSMRYNDMQEAYHANKFSFLTERILKAKIAYERGNIEELKKIYYELNNINDEFTAFITNKLYIKIKNLRKLDDYDDRD